MDTIEMLRKRIELARAARDAEYEDRADKGGAAMRRLLSFYRPIAHTHLPTAGAHACRHTCPRRFFSASLSSARSVGLGRCRSSAPASFWR